MLDEMASDVGELDISEFPEDSQTDQNEKLVAEAPRQFDSSELDAFAESLVDETLTAEPDFAQAEVTANAGKSNVHSLVPEDFDIPDSAVEDDSTELADELDDILQEMAEMKAQSSAKLSELQLPETAMELAAADFAEAAISVADVNNLLTDDDDLDSQEDDAAQQVSANDSMPELSTEAGLPADFHADDIMLEDELEASLSLAELEDTHSQNHSLEGNSFESDRFKSDSVESNAFEQAQATADDLNIEQQLAAEASAESEYLNEFAELEALDMPDLETGDDNSVAKFEPPSSVERPSQLLDSYPELEMTEDGDLIFDEDDTANETMVDVDELLLDLDQPVDLASLKELDDTNFDELLSELAEVELPDDDLAANEPFDVDLSLEDELLNSADAENSSLSAEVPALPDFVNIDRLLAATDEDQAAVDPASRLNIDVGLADFDDLILPEEAGDVDATDNGFAGKMDLVRAYIEIGDGESANQLIKDIMASDAPAHVKQEALSLKS